MVFSCNTIKFNLQKSKHFGNIETDWDKRIKNGNNKSSILTMSKIMETWPKRSSFSLSASWIKCLLKDNNLWSVHQNIKRTHISKQFKSITKLKYVVMSQTKPVNISSFVTGNNVILLICKYYNCCASDHFSKIVMSNKESCYEIWPGISI